MKRYLFFIAILSVMMACKKTSYVPVFDKTPQERAADQINLVSTTLTGAPNGWIATLPTQAGGGYGFYFAFDKEQNVTMYGDLTITSAGTVGKSNYRVKQDIGTELVFDTYNYISILDDPNGTLGGTPKVGYSSDIEFVFDRISGDSIIFTGKKYRQPFKLVKATAAQQAAYTTGSTYPALIASMKGFFSKNANTFITLSDGTRVDLVLDHSNTIQSGKRIKVNAQKAGVTMSASAKYAVTIDQLPILNSELTIDGITFVKILMKAPNSFVIVDSKGVEYPIQRVEVLVKTVIETKNPLFTIADATTFPGWSSDFSTRRAIANTSTGRWTNAGSTLRLEKVTLQNFNITAKTFLIKVYTAKTSDGTVPSYTFDMNYTFSFIDDNTIKFNWVAGVDANGTNYHNTDMPALLGQRLDVDNFKMDYFTDTVTGNIYGRFTSVQHPDFVFTVSF